MYVLYLLNAINPHVVLSNFPLFLFIYFVHFIIGSIIKCRKSGSSFKLYSLKSNITHISNWLYWRIWWWLGTKFWCCIISCWNKSINLIYEIKVRIQNLIYYFILICIYKTIDLILCLEKYYQNELNGDYWLLGHMYLWWKYQIATSKIFFFLAVWEDSLKSSIGWNDLTFQLLRKLSNSMRSRYTLKQFWIWSFFS